MAVFFADLLSNLGAQHEAVLSERDRLAVENQHLRSQLAAAQADLTETQGPVGEDDGGQLAAAPLRRLEPEALHRSPPLQELRVEHPPVAAAEEPTPSPPPELPTPKDLDRQRQTPAAPKGDNSAPCAEGGGTGKGVEFSVATQDSDQAIAMVEQSVSKPRRLSASFSSATLGAVGAVSNVSGAVFGSPVNKDRISAALAPASDVDPTQRALLTQGSKSKLQLAHAALVANSFAQTEFTLRVNWKTYLRTNAEDAGILARERELHQVLRDDLVSAMTQAEALSDWEDCRNMSTTRTHAATLHGRVSIREGMRAGCSGWCIRSMLVHPQSRFVIVWDFSGVAIVGWDIVVTPLQLLWEEQEHPFITTMDFTVLVFWTLDILLSCRTGFYKGGNPVMDARKICFRYIKTWFFFDLLVVLPEWIAIASAAVVPIGDSSSVFKLFRVVRFLRLMRMMKLQRFKHEIMCRIHSNSWLFAIRIFAWLCTAVSIMHIFACIWYGIGRSESGGWVKEFNVLQYPVHERYAIALQWSFGNIQGSAPVYPVTLYERIFCLFVSPLCVGLVVLLISATTNMLQGQRYFKVEYHERAARSFLARHKLLPSTAVRMQKIVEDESRLLDQREADDDIVKLLPKELLREIMVQVRGAVISNRSNILIYSERHFSQFFKHMCHEVLKNEFWREGDVIFRPGNVCSSGRCVAKGRLLYEVASVEANKLTAREATKSCWACEVVLWTPWKNIGTLRAAEETLIFNVPVDMFSKVVSDYTDVRYTMALYAQHYLIHVNSMEQPNDLMMNLPPNVWDPEQFDQARVIRDSEPIPLPWGKDLPPQLNERVCKVAVVVAQKIASNGLDENRPHHGFTIIVGDEKALDHCGKAGFNPFFGHNMRLLDSCGVLDEEVFDTLRRNAFGADGAIVVNAANSKIVASGWFVSDISKGGTQGGARSRSAKAVAQQAGRCYVIKCSEDSRGEVILHLGKEKVAFDGTLELDPPWSLSRRARMTGFTLDPEDGEDEAV